MSAAKNTFSWADAPRLDAADAAAMLWSERVAVIGTGATVCLVGFALAMAMPKTYAAHAELLVRLGPEYVYQPNGTGAGAGAAPDMQSVINSEMRMLSSDAVAERVINRVGLRTLYPAIASSSAPEAVKLATAEHAFAQQLSIDTAPQTPAIALSFKHDNAVIAAQVLNALVDQYLDYRREMLVGGESDALSHQSNALDTRAAAANTALSNFLATNGIADFDAEMIALAARATDAETQSYDAAAKLGEAQGRAAALRARMHAEPAEIQLYSESDARRQLVELQMQREQLLSRYQDDAPPVHEIDRRINQLNAFLSNGDPASLTRRGVNPVRQQVETDLYAAEADARAQRGRSAALQTQREQVLARLGLLRALEPQFRQLMRERTILETNAGNFATRAEEARSFSQLLGRSTDNISQVERATPPVQGKSLRMPIALLSLMLAAIAGVAVGLVRALLRGAFPTPTSAARTLRSPVLAIAPIYRVKATKPVRAPNVKSAKIVKEKLPEPANDLHVESTTVATKATS